jgi:hypothetical protein
MGPAALGDTSNTSLDYTGSKASIFDHQSEVITFGRLGGMCRPDSNVRNR